MTGMTNFRKRGSAVVVYADVLVALNFLIDLLLLLACGKLLGVAFSKKRLSFAAFVGAVSSLMIFLPQMHWLLTFLIQVSLMFLMAGIAFGWKPVQRLIRCVLVLWIASMLFAGVMTAIAIAAEPLGMLIYNGVIYFDISAFALLACISAAYLIVILTEKLFLSRSKERDLFDLTIFTSGKTITIKGLSDTGNNLKEPFSGAPVIICDAEMVEKIHPGPDSLNIRIIPCLTVTGEGMLEAFRPDEVIISGKSGHVVTSDVYIAASREPICGEYQALIHPQVFRGT